LSTHFFQVHDVGLTLEAVILFDMYTRTYLNTSPLQKQPLCFSWFNHKPWGIICHLLY